jgi:hypothetical protein
MTSTSIPVDILRVILKYLDRADLVKICQLNKICCSCSQDILYRKVLFEDVLVCRALAQSTHLARRVRSFKSMGKPPELSKALQNMTSLRDLTLFDSGSSSILENCVFNLDSFTCDFSYDKSLRQFLEHQSSITYVCLLRLYEPSEPFELTRLPNLTRVAAPSFLLPHLIPGRPVIEVDSIGGLHVGDSIDLSHYTLSTTPIRKLTINFLLLYPHHGHILASIFPSLTHLNIGIHNSLFSMQIVRLLSFLFILLIYL